MTDTPNEDDAETSSEAEAATSIEHTIPYRFERDATNQSIIDEFGDIEDGTRSGKTVSIAGRLMLRREQGKLAFGVLADSTARVQLFARSNQTPNFDQFTSLSLGDWIGVTGQVMEDPPRPNSRSASIAGKYLLRPSEHSLTSFTASTTLTCATGSVTSTCG